ncbi:MAG: hypothetical protein JZD40_05570 [Sulfolobus sp.]|nr:hypothetical protein [Sulfolobus sp.]
MRLISKYPEKLFGVIKWAAIIVATSWASAHFYTVAIYKKYNNPTLPGLIHGWTVT